MSKRQCGEAEGMYGNNSSLDSSVGYIVGINGNQDRKSKLGENFREP